VASFKRLFTIVVEKWSGCGPVSENRARNHPRISTERETIIAEKTAEDAEKNLEEEKEKAVILVML
jgi:hypothetical protein